MGQQMGNASGNTLSVADGKVSIMNHTKNIYLSFTMLYSPETQRTFTLSGHWCVNLSPEIVNGPHLVRAMVGATSNLHVFLGKKTPVSESTFQWIGLRENLQETIDFPII